MIQFNFFLRVGFKKRCCFDFCMGGATELRDRLHSWKWKYQISNTLFNSSYLFTNQLNSHSIKTYTYLQILNLPWAHQIAERALWHNFIFLDQRFPNFSYCRTFHKSCNFNGTLWLFYRVDRLSSREFTTLSSPHSQK